MALNEAVVFPVADMLQVALHVIGDGIKAHQPETVNVNGWKVQHDMKVKSDFLGKETASFFVQVRKNLWLYVLSYKGGKALKCMVFDASVAKIANGFMATACQQGILDMTINRLLAAKAQMFAFDHDEQKWVSCEHVNDVIGGK